jgi:hypothetical protein
MVAGLLSCEISPHEQVLRSDSIRVGSRKAGAAPEATEQSVSAIPHSHGARDADFPIEMLADEWHVPRRNRGNERSVGSERRFLRVPDNVFLIWIRILVPQSEEEVESCKASFKSVSIADCGLERIN